MKEICQKAGLVGNYANHSSKRTCATSLYKAGLDEQSIIDRKGHRSTADRGYKSKTDEVEKKVSEVLNPPKSPERDLKVAAAGTPLETERSVSINTESPQNPEKRAKLCGSADAYDNSDRDPDKRSCWDNIIKTLDIIQVEQTILLTVISIFHRNRYQGLTRGIE